MNLDFDFELSFYFHIRVCILNEQTKKRSCLAFRSIKQKCKLREKN